VLALEVDVFRIPLAAVQCRNHFDCITADSAVSPESIRGDYDTANIASHFEVIRKGYEKEISNALSPLCCV
jgi:hypothetical protein